MNSQIANEAQFRSGVAARMSGVHVETLRIWERRYKVVGPEKSPGRQRLYSAADIRRLTLVKQLVDMGHPIGAIATLSTDTLLRMRTHSQPNSPVQYSANEPHTGVQPVRLALVGAFVSTDMVADHLRESGLDVVARFGDFAAARGATPDAPLDAVVVELATLTDTDIERLISLRTGLAARQAIVLYRFAPSQLIRRLRINGIAAARAASDVAQIRDLIGGLLRPGDSALPSPLSWEEMQPSPPKFDPATLAAFANESRTVECECPRHMANLVMDLVSFEQYSASCSNRNQADAALHADLQRSAGLARTIIERALERLALAEGMSLSERRAAA